MSNVIPITSAKRKSSKEPYNFDPGWERGLVASVCLTQKFYALVGEELDPDCLGNPVCKLALQAAQAIAKADPGGRGPHDGRQVMQRLRAWMTDGKITLENVDSVLDLFDAEEDRGLPDRDALLAELKPLLQRRIHFEALETGLAEFQKKGDPTRALASLARASSIGTAARGIGSRFGPASIDRMAALMKVQRLKTGLPELDDAIEGGALRGTLSMFLGGSGAGKSMGLAQVAAAAARQGFHVGVVTLEVPEEIWTARLIANLVGDPVNDILAHPYTCGAIEKLDAFLAEPGFGRIQLHSFTAKATTPDHVAAWVKECEQTHGQTMDVIVVDYADKLGARGRSDRDSTYSSAGSVYEDLYNYAKDNSKWMWTASQSTRGDGRSATRVLDMDDVADSMHKIRNADLVVTLNPRDNYESMVFFTAKNRLGKPRQTVGPYPCDFAFARIAPIMEGILIQ